MERRELGNSGIMVSPLALGTWQFGDGTGLHAKQTADGEATTVQAALDAGINFFDTAALYVGQDGASSEQALGVALRACGVAREDVVIATKVGPESLAPDDLVRACERSLAALEMDYIDLYQIHWPNHDIPIADTMQALASLVEQGKVRAVGVSNFGPQDTAEAVAAGEALGVPIVSNQLPYSLCWRLIEKEIMGVCARSSVGVLAYSPLMQGLLTGKYTSPDDCPPALSRSRLFNSTRSSMSRHSEDGVETALFEALAAIRDIATELDVPMASLSLAWVMAQPGVTSVIFGASVPEHVERNVAAAQLTLSPEVNERLRLVTDALLNALGDNVDCWDSENGGRYR